MSHSTFSLANNPTRVDDLWQKANVDFEVMGRIIESHFKSIWVSRAEIGGGAYAKAVKFSLENGMEVVSRVTLPVNDRVKTEAEVAAMDSMRAHTSIPITNVYLFCSSSNNPVRAEWVVMDYVHGEQWCECFHTLTWEKKKTAADDLARIMADTFALTATHCGSMLADLTLRDDQKAIRYNGDDGLASLTGFRTVESCTSRGTYLLAPINDLVFFDRELGIVPPSHCGPFATEHEYVEAIAFRGIPGMRGAGKADRWPYEKALDLYNIIRPLFRDSDTSVSTPQLPVFHFAHNDLSAHNILLDPRTGHITAVIDWEMSGFCPSWWAALPGPWFDDDYRRFIIDGLQDAPDGSDDESRKAKDLRQYFRDALRRLSPSLFNAYWNGVELRAIHYNIGEALPGNLLGWMDQYEKFQWDYQRGPFPFDYGKWFKEYCKLAL